MIIQRNDNLSVLPFYASKDEQLHRRPYAYGDIYPLYTPVGTVPPFQFITPHSQYFVRDIVLTRLDGTSAGHILGYLTEAGYRKIPFASEGYDVHIYPSQTQHEMALQEGQYYLTVIFNDASIIYSDVFTVVGEMGGYLYMQWWDTQDLVMDGSRIVYDDNGQNIFRNALWLNTQLGKPDYEFEEEGEQRDGLFFPEKMISYKRYKFTILASEYLCDVMRFIRLSDFIRLWDRYGNTYQCDTFQMSPKWEVQGNLASVEVEFTCDTVAKKLPYGYRPAEADFNSDYNSDYYIQIINNNNN